jgi:hypothetical protein
MSRLYKLEGKKAVRVTDEPGSEEWLGAASRLESGDNCVAQDFVDGVKDEFGTEIEIHVSTVFLGINHNFRGEGPPIVFETMVFGGAFDRQQRRYATWEEAEWGHIEILTEILDSEKSAKLRPKGKNGGL